MLVCVCGSRDWVNREAIKRELLIVKERAEQAGKTLTVMHGGARGADSIAGEVAESLGLPVKAYPARWQTLGASAGMLRNQYMIDLGPDLVLAFAENLERSRGTLDTIKRAVAAVIPVNNYDR